MNQQAVGTIKRIAVLGAGNGGITFAAHFRSTPGVEWVSLYNRSRGRLESIWANDNRIYARGEIGGADGQAMVLDLVTSDPVQAASSADLILLAGTQQSIAPLGRALAPHVTSGQAIMIGSGTLGSTWEMVAELRAGRCTDLPVVGEFNILPYATKLDGGQEGRVWVRGIKQALDAAFSVGGDLPAGLKAWLLGVYPYLNIFPDPLYTGLSGANMVAHPVVVLRNQHKVRAGEPWPLYAEGVTHEVGDLMEAVDQERLAIARACGVMLPPMYEFLATAYPPFDGVAVTNLYEWFHSRMRSAAGQIHLEAVPGPISFRVRLIEEDVPYGMVPLEALGQLVGVAAPTVSMFIDEANELLGVDYRATGRSLARIGTEMRQALARSRSCSTAEGLAETSDNG
jgi:opine dehydrogenase